MAKLKTILLVANGDLRQSANEVCWPAQHAMEQTLTAAVAKLGFKLVRAHPYKAAQKHGFISSQKEGMEVFAGLDPKTPLIVAEAVWQYSHHLLAGLISHQAPILTVANWSGTWPGLVGMLNLNGSLTKAGVKYSTLWSDDFSDALSQSMAPEQADAIFSGYANAFTEAYREAFGPTEAILDIAKIESGNITLRRKPINVADIVRQSIQVVEGPARAATVTLDAKLPARLRPVTGTCCHA